MLSFKCVFLSFLMIINASTKTVYSQKQQFKASDTIKTVAIYSLKKSFFKDYPIDTLVSHLNSLNANPKIIYYKSTEDRSKTGFYADYLIDLDLWLKLSVLVAPKWETVSKSTPANVSVRQADGTYEDVLTTITTKEEKYIDAFTKPGQGEIRIKIIQKSKNEKVIRKTLSATNNKEQSLKFLLIIELIEFLLAYF